MICRIAVSLMTVLLLGWAARAQSAGPVAPPAPGAARDVEFFKNVVYGTGGGRDLTLNLARPKASAGPAPCVVVLHGGAWAHGRKERHDDIVRMLAARGYVAATVGYRLSDEDPFPAQVEDAKCAVRFLRAHADRYGIDPGRIGAVGFSAGAHLAMLLGVTDKADGMEGTGGWADQSSKVGAVVSFFGPTDLTAPEMFGDFSPPLKQLIGGWLSQKPEAFRRASPLYHVGPTSAPMLLIQGTNDLMVNWRQATRMAEALTKHDVDGRVELLIGQGHGRWPAAEYKRSGEAMVGFFDEKLGKPR